MIKSHTAYTLCYKSYKMSHLQLNTVWFLAIHLVKSCTAFTQVEEEYQYEKYTREQVEKEQKRIEAERAERLRERLRDREALKWNNRRAGQTRAQERMDTGEESDAYPVRLRYVYTGNHVSSTHLSQRISTLYVDLLNNRQSYCERSYVLGLQFTYFVH